MQETQFYISGLKCDGCIAASRAKLEEVTGYESSEFDLKAGEMKVIGDVDPQAIITAINDAGYSAVVKSA
jgi:copper chaperone CopZ